MLLAIILGIIALAFVGLLPLLYVSTKRFRRLQPNTLPWGVNGKLLCVMGSGGHTSEMCIVLRQVPHEKFPNRVAVVADTDSLSGPAAKAVDPELRVVSIRRSREVKQSWLSTVFSTFAALLQALRLVWRERPALVLLNGPGTCVPIALAALLFKTYIPQRRHTAIVFVESATRVHGLSLSGLICYAFADAFYVQWPAQLQRWRHAELLSLLPVVADSEPQPQPQQADHTALQIEGRSTPATLAGGRVRYGRRRVFVTVGSTKFDPLIRAVDSEAVAAALREIGVEQLVVQYGAGEYQPQFAHLRGVDTTVFARRDSIASELQAADLVIAHGGTGSVLEALQYCKPAVLVPNRTLMADHQTAFVRQVAARYPTLLLACVPASQHQDLASALAVAVRESQWLPHTRLQAPNVEALFVRLRGKRS